MAKIPSTRLTKAPEEYQRNLFDLLFDDLRRIINLLNATYLTDIENKDARRNWFLNGWYLFKFYVRTR